MADTATASPDKTFRQILNIDLRLLSLLLVIAVYAVGGEPTPDHLGGVEIFLAAGLVLAVGIQGAYFASDIGNGDPLFKMGRLFLLYGLVSCVLIGFMQGNALSLILRDIIPFLFLFLPVFLWPLIRGMSQKEKVLLTGAVCFAGIAFALRVLIPAGASFSVPFSMTISPQDTALLANAPTVLFAAVLLMSLAFVYMTRSFQLRSLLLAALCIGAAIIPLAAMTAIEQRASIGYIILALALLLVVGCASKPYRMAFPLIFLSAALYVFAPMILNILDVLGQKHTMVGLNQRGAEARAVMDAVTGNIWNVLFGNGWGATIASPAVGGAVVNFTHSLVSATFLKTGLVGVVLLIGYLYQLSLMLARLLRHKIYLALALVGPFMIDIFLYASYKSLDFGLILLLIVLWADRSPLLNKPPAYSTQ